MNPNRVGAVIDNPDVDAAVARGLDLPADAAPISPPVTPTTASNGGGGGALGAGWLLALALAVGLLARAKPTARG